MANIKNLQMWNEICADAFISVRKSMLGLKTTVVYVPTQSVIDARTIEYSPQDGDRLRRILSTPREDLAEVINGFRPKEVPNGNYMLEIARSRDGQFVALLLQQFMQMSYEPVTSTIFFEGVDAQIISQLF